MNTSAYNPNQSLIDENQRLKSQCKTLMEKEQMYKNTILSIKQTQQEMEENYQKSYEEYKEREAKLRNRINRLQSAMTNDKTINEGKLYDENTSLRNKVNELIEKSSNNSLAYELKENDYRELIKSKDKQLYELEQSINRITKEAEVESAKLSRQIQQFELRLNNYPFDNEELGYTASGSDIKTQQYGEMIEELKYKNGLLQKENDNLIIQLRNKTLENNTLIEQLGKIALNRQEYFMKETLGNDGNEGKEREQSYCHHIMSRNSTEQRKLLREYDSFENLILSKSSSNNMTMGNDNSHSHNKSPSHLRQYKRIIPHNHNHNHNNSKSPLSLSAYSIHNSCLRQNSNKSNNSLINNTFHSKPNTTSIHRLIQLQNNDKLTKNHSKVHQ